MDPKTIELFNHSFLVTKEGDVVDITNGRCLLKKFYRNKKTGYYQFNVSDKNKQHAVYRHILIATAFVHKPYGCDEVNHINGVRGDDRVENLEWVTTLGNVHHAYNTGLVKARKMYAVQCVETREIFPSYCQAAVSINSNPHQIKMSCLKGYCARGYHFKYINKSNEKYKENQ